jgi:hypothetical protein
MGKIDDENRPETRLRELGFRQFPGPVITEITGTTNAAHSTKK